ncbi:deoxycytidylate deaminase isoform X2 [Fopius arisanus]|uniref:Probable deoxycytidylate deaminase n=1 Tax=Fopius arisanus TaxID=64838 RepID=A0A9R1SVJ6_9HYME|nr:PREDICTED: deoxycytidylate deaminase isoform X2 [Fopius arisanus]
MIGKKEIQYRTNYLSWEDYFMAVAFLSSQRSKDPCTQVGACIVNDMNVIVATGYNGMPKGCSDDDFPWQKNTENRLDSKFLYVCHAEVNAILNKNSDDVRNCRIYVGLFPCNECAKVIIQSGITKVIYMSDQNSHKPETIASKKMFEAAKVEYRQYIPKQKKIVIDFNQIDWNNQDQGPPTPLKKNIAL